MRRIIPVLLTFLILISWACHDRIIVYPPPKVTVAPPPQTDEVPPAVKTAPICFVPLIPQPPAALKAADASFLQGKYLQAIKDYEAFLKDNPQAEAKDRVLLNIGISHALAPDSGRSLSRSKTVLKLLIESFPDSAYKIHAEFILDMIGQAEKLNLSVQTRDEKVKQLEEELQRLKEIDLKRRPSRPEKQ